MARIAAVSSEGSRRKSVIVSLNRFANAGEDVRAEAGETTAGGGRVMPGRSLRVV
jgi:hypothetical protein